MSPGPRTVAFAAGSLVLLAVPAYVGRTRLVRFVRRPLAVVRDFAAAHPEHVRAIVAFELAYQVLAVAEVYLTLLLISPLRPTLASSLMLETVSRAITMVFKMLPMRVGVDEASSSLFAGHLDLGAATGLTLALVRKLRMLFWSAVGLALLVERRSHAPTGAGVVVACCRPARAVKVVMVSAYRAFIGLLAASVLSAGLPVHAQALPAGVVSGTVSLPAPDGQPVVVPGVTLTLTCPGTEPRERRLERAGAVRVRGGSRRSTVRSWRSSRASNRR